MGKRKSNMQKREIAAKQKLNKARKAEKLRQVLKRNFDDMTPLPQWEIKRYLAWVDSVKKSHILSRDFSDMRPAPKWYFNWYYKRIAADEKYLKMFKRKKLLFRKF